MLSHLCCDARFSIIPCLTESRTFCPKFMMNPCLTDFINTGRMEQNCILTIRLTVTIRADRMEQQKTKSFLTLLSPKWMLRMRSLCSSSNLSFLLPWGFWSCQRIPRGTTRDERMMPNWSPAYRKANKISRSCSIDGARTMKIVVCKMVILDSKIVWR
jgi:hypothetical protein